MLTENLWPKLFSEAPRCAPLRLADSKASGVPSRKAFKIKENEIFGLVGIACPGKELLQAPRCKAMAKEAVENGFSGSGWMPCALRDEGEAHFQQNDSSL